MTGRGGGDKEMRHNGFKGGKEIDFILSPVLNVLR
jgi:hypothetical protein